jgi:hypothetical protein
MVFQGHLAPGKDRLTHDDPRERTAPDDSQSYERKPMSTPRNPRYAQLCAIHRNRKFTNWSAYTRWRTLAMVTNEMIRLLVRWYGVSEASAFDIIGELRDLSVLLCLASGRMVRARAVEAKCPGTTAQNFTG